MGQRDFFTERLLRQHQDRGRLFIASVADEIVGDVYLSLEKADEPELRLHLPAVPLLQHLEVRDGFRDRGIGTALIDTVETFLVRLCHAQVALGVDLDNHNAMRLYRRLGYQEWKMSPIKTFREHRRPNGSTVREEEECRVFVKVLPVPARIGG